jgi:hypothetical protein
MGWRSSFRARGGRSVIPSASTGLLLICHDDASVVGARAALGTARAT